MPIYEYLCEKCGHQFETMQKVSEAPLRTCPQCAQESLRKKISPAGFRLKGGGWYETDFKGGRKKNVAGEQSTGDGASSGGEKGGSAAGADTKSGDGAGGGKATASD